VRQGRTDLRDDEDVPMPLAECSVPDTLVDLAPVLRITDMTWPRYDDEAYVALRALAWSRCHDHLPDWSDREELPEAEHDRLLAEFTATCAASALSADAATVRSLADLFLDYGENYIASVLCRGVPCTWRCSSQTGCLARSSTRRTAPSCLQY
jgi:hypothetical protein